MTNDKQRERLVELLCESMADICGGVCKEPIKTYCAKCRHSADYLLTKGVIVPPCKVGDTVYSIDNCINRPEMIVVTSIHHHKKHTFFSALSRSQREYCFEEKDIGKTVFLTKEEAEKALGGAE